MMEVQNQNLKSIAQTPWLSLWNLNYQAQNQQHDWAFVSRENNRDALVKRLQEGRRYVDAVSIVPFIKTADGYNIVVIREFRPVLGGWEFSFPAGLIDPGETPEAAAIRELREETGLTAVRIFNKSPFIYSSAGCTDEALHMLFCEAEGEITNTHNEENEQIEIYVFSLTALGDLVLGLGEFQKAMHSARSWTILYMIYVMSKQMSSNDIFRSLI